jgi:hypothetical protein
LNNLNQFEFDIEFNLTAARYYSQGPPISAPAFPTSPARACRRWPPHAARPRRRSPTSSSALPATWPPSPPPPNRVVKRALPSPPHLFSLPPPSSSLLEQDRAPHPPCLMSTSVVDAVAIPPGNRSCRHRFNPSR